MTYHNENIEALVAASDEALVRLARQGHTRAFEMLVKRYEQPLYNYLRRLSGNGTDAEDLFQETFLRVYGNLDRFKDTGRFRPWVYQIATNLCRDRIRYRKRRPQVSLDQPLNEEAGPATVMDRLASANAGPGEQAIAHETAARIEAALAALPAKHRAVFLMARYDGLAYDEIARVLRVPVGTVKSRMNKAVRLLMDALEVETP